MSGLVVVVAIERQLMSKLSGIEAGCNYLGMTSWACTLVCIFLRVFDFWNGGEIFVARERQE
jgi:hypothetical protein